jgi:hypothetical protein
LKTNTTRGQPQPQERLPAKKKKKVRKELSSELLVYSRRDTADTRKGIKRVQQNAWRKKKKDKVEANTMPMQKRTPMM